MKQYIDKLKTISQELENSEVKVQLDSITAALDNQYMTLQGKLKLTTKESIDRKQKLRDSYERLNEMDTLKLKLNQYESEIQNLSKYRIKAIQQKKMYNAKIKTFFDTKLSNSNNKDYSKFATIYTQFNFQSDDESVLDHNKRNYQLLQLAGTFGNDKLLNNTTLPKPNPAGKNNTTSRWNRTK